MKKKKIKTAIGIILLVVSVICMNGVLYWQTIGLSKYDRTTGVVTEADPVYHADADIHSNRTQYITFTYTYQGKTYTDA